MALRDISNVTQTLINLLDRAFQVPANWTGAPPAVLPSPPIRSNANGIGVYLYHISENTHYKNLPAPGRNTPPVRFTSMGLNLYYQVSANSTGAEPEADNAMLEQQMMAVALKAFHDYPEISDTTVYEGSTDLSPVFHVDLMGRGNRFKISLQPIPHTEAVSFWTSGETPLTLAAYYEVSVVLLEPETITSRAGKVLEYNIFSFVSGAPRILNSYNTLSFNSPVDGSPREIRLQPAQVPIGDAVNFDGVDFVGDQVRLQLIFKEWPTPAYATAAWGVSVNKQTLSATVQQSAELADGTPMPVLPGIYGARVEVTRTHATSGQIVRQASNQCPFTIAPRLDPIVPVATINDTWTISGAFFTATGGGGEELIEIDVFVGQHRLTVPEAPAPFSNGNYRIVDAMTLEFILPTGLTTNQILPFRIFANGAESPPQWITVPGP